MKITRCEYAKSCSIYKGEEETVGIAHNLYKNVFCNRRPRGWENCTKYLNNKMKEKKLQMTNDPK